MRVQRHLAELGFGFGLGILYSARLVQCDWAHHGVIMHPRIDTALLLVDMWVSM
jgi:hypothetical protein